MSGNTELQGLQVQRVVSNLLVGTNWEQDFIAERVLPPINTGSMNFAYATFGNEGMRDVETRRAPNAEPNKISISTGSQTGELEEHTIETQYDYVRLQASAEGMKDNGDAFRMLHGTSIRQLVQIQKEKQVAGIVFAAGNYGSNTAANVDFGATGLRAAVLAAKDARQQATGRRIGKGIAGQTTHRELLSNPDIIDAIKYSKGGVTSSQLIAEYLELDEYLVGSAASQTPASNGGVGTPTALWTADNFALIASDGPTDPNTGFSSNGTTHTQSFAKLFTMNSPLSGARVAVRTWVPDPGLFEKMLYSEFFKAAVVFSAAGYLWTSTADA